MISTKRKKPTGFYFGLPLNYKSVSENWHLGKTESSMPWTYLGYLQLILVMSCRFQCRALSHISLSLLLRFLKKKYFNANLNDISNICSNFSKIVFWYKFDFCIFLGHENLLNSLISVVFVVSLEKDSPQR